jgi:hypothetical protein
MAEKYLGYVTNTNVFKVQELIRVLDATIGEINPDGLVTGQNCLSIIKYLSSVEGFENFVSPDFISHIQKEVLKSESKENVREHVKKILTYPRTGYLPWIELEVNQEILKNISDDAEKLKFKLQIVEGKVYGVCVSEQKLNNIVYNKIKDHIPSTLKLNFETCHITVVNSNVVSDIGIDIVKQFVDKYNEEFTITTGKIKSTFSEDWSRFGECYVIELECSYIDKFLLEFNQQFNKNIKICKHITFAIEPRSLWY